LARRGLRHLGDDGHHLLQVSGKIGNKHATRVVLWPEGLTAKAYIRQHDASTTTTAALPKWQPGKLHP